MDLPSFADLFVLKFYTVLTILSVPADGDSKTSETSGVMPSKTLVFLAREVKK